MKIYDDAHKLAKQIRESKEYKEYKELKENIESNPVKKAQVEEFEHLRYKIQVETMQGSGNATEAKQMLQEKYAELLKDEEIRKYFKDKVFNTIIPRLVRLVEAPSHGKPINEYDPLSRATEAYANLAKEVVSRDGN